jgi:hypothetical protein
LAKKKEKVESSHAKKKEKVESSHAILNAIVFLDVEMKCQVK